MPAKPTKVTITFDDGSTADFGPAAAVNVPATPLPTPVPPTPTPVPPAPTPTPPPVMALKRAPALAARGDGFSYMNKPGLLTVLGDTLVDNFEQNIVAQNVGGVTLRNVVSANAHRANVGDRFKGQAFYASHAGPITLIGYAALMAGWQPPTDPRQRIGFFHGVYSNWGSGDVLLEDFVLWGCAHSGAQFRGIAEDPDVAPLVAGKVTPRRITLRRGVIIDCGIGVTAVAGNVSIDDVVIYKGHRWFEKKADGSPSWPGDIAISSYTDTSLNNVLILGAPNQDQPTYGEPANDPHYDLGAVMGSRRYNPHPECSNGAKWTVSPGCRIRGWPGPHCSGDAPCPESLWQIDARPPVEVNLDDLYGQLISGTRPVKDVRADLAARLRLAAA